MELNRELIEKFSEKFVRRYLNRWPVVAHIREDLKQEAAIAIARYFPQWKEGGAPLDNFLYIYARKAMQRYTSEQAGPVSRPPNVDGYTGTQSQELLGDDFNYMPHRNEVRTPETEFERQEANEIVRDLVDRRATCFSGKGKVPVSVIKQALTDRLAGDTFMEVAQRYGFSKQRMHKLATIAGIE